MLSFVFLGIYWNNHHHMLQMTDRINGRILWANLHLLFWLSLVPFVTGWMGENHFAPLPTALYGAVLWLAGVAYFILEKAIIAHQGPGSRLAAAVGTRDEGQGFRALSMPWRSRWRSCTRRSRPAIYVFVALMWLVPDRRIESRVHH